MGAEGNVCNKLFSPHYPDSISWSSPSLFDGGGGSEKMNVSPLCLDHPDIGIVCRAG